MRCRRLGGAIDAHKQTPILLAILLQPSRRIFFFSDIGKYLKQNRVGFRVMQISIAIASGAVRIVAVSNNVK
jgi:hypothetical protein